MDIARFSYRYYQENDAAIGVGDAEVVVTTFICVIGNPNYT